MEWTEQHKEIVRLLQYQKFNLNHFLEAGIEIDLNVVDEKKYTLLFHALVNDCYPLFHYLCEQKKNCCCSFAWDAKGESILHKLCEKQNIVWLRKFYAFTSTKGYWKHLLYQGTFAGKLPIHVAAQKQNITIVKFLLSTCSKEEEGEFLEYALRTTNSINVKNFITNNRPDIVDKFFQIF